MSLLLAVLVVIGCVLVVPANAEGCSPSNAVVAVVSVVSTLVVIALILVAIFLVLRRRRNKESYLKTHKTSGPGGGDTTDGYINAGFDRSDPTLAEEGLITIDKRGPKHGKKKDVFNAKTWSSFPEREQPGTLYRPGSCGSLDENMQPNSEILTVCLESQDIIGLGFNISGNFGEGIQVSQVHNRGPAVESGNIKVGDKILSVEVSYENIVYEDALTILSYASPYPVKITLQKSDARRSRDSALLYKKDNNAISTAAGGDKAKLVASQLNHPLYRSQSLDVFKHASAKARDPHTGTAAPFQPKRTQSEMKPETRKDGGGGGGKPRKKGDRNSKSFVHDVLDKIAGTISPSKFSSSSNPHEVVVVSDVEVHQERKGNNSHQQQDVQMETFPPTRTNVRDDISDEFTPTNSVELASLMDDKFDLKHDDGFENIPLSSPSEGSPVVPPSKPERKSKKLGSFDSNRISTESSEIESDERVVNSDAEEEVIVPSVKRTDRQIGRDDIHLEPLEFRPTATGKYENMDEALSPLSNVQILSVSIDRSPSPDDNMVVEDLIQASEAKRDSSAISLSSFEKAEAQPVEKTRRETETTTSSTTTSTTEIGINTENLEEEKESNQPEVESEEPTETAPPALDEAMLEKLIAMNSYDPGTQGWAGIQAGGNQGGVFDDFVPPNSKQFVSQPVRHNNNLNEDHSNASSRSGSSSRPMSPPSLAFEIRDDITGTPVAVGIKAKPGTRDSSPATPAPSSAPIKHSHANSSSNKNISSNKPTTKDSSYHHSIDSSSVSNKSYSVGSSSSSSSTKNNKNTSSNNNNNKNNNNNSNNSDDTFSSSDIINTSKDVTSFTRLSHSDRNIPESDSPTKGDWIDSRSIDNQIVNSSYDRCIDDLTDSDSESAMTENPPSGSRINFQGSKDAINNRRSQLLADNSDVSNSFTSSSGEATPPYSSSNGQELELGSSPEFSVSKSPLELMSGGNLEADSPSSPAISLALDRPDDHSDVEC